jgi:hypothetical protein
MSAGQQLAADTRPETRGIGASPVAGAKTRPPPPPAPPSLPPPPSPRALFDGTFKKRSNGTFKKRSFFSIAHVPRSALRSPSIYGGEAWRMRTRGVVDFIRWSLPLPRPLRRRHRAMAVNPVMKLRGSRAHTEAMVLGLLKKSPQNRAPAWGSCQITAKRFVGPRNLPIQLIGCVTLLPSDRINLNFSSGRVQGQFLSPWSKSGAFYTKEPRYSLCVYQCGSRKPAAGVSKKWPTFS